MYSTAMLQNIVDLMNMIMGAILLLMIIILLIMHYTTEVRLNWVHQLRQMILHVLSEEERQLSLSKEISDSLNGSGTSLDKIRGIRSKRGVLVLTEIAHEIDSQQYTILQRNLEMDWFHSFLNRILQTNDEDYIILCMNLIGQMMLDGYIDLILKNVKKNCKNPKTQESGLYALFRTGHSEQIPDIFIDASYHLTIAFRTLQQLFADYGGDHRKLYESIIDRASDAYVRKACIAGIGNEQMTDLAESLVPYLKSDNLNLQVEAIRSCGKLKYHPVMSDLFALLKNANWEVRFAAVDALAEIDLAESRDAIMHCLCDPQWWVRYHAAKTLAQCPDAEEILAQVRTYSDPYAVEILNFMIEENELMKGGVKDGSVLAERSSVH